MQGGWTEGAGDAESMEIVCQSTGGIYSNAWGSKVVAGRMSGKRLAVGR